MRKAGITLGVQEVENVMSEMDEQMREVQDITEVLSNPLNALGPEEADLDAELDLLDALGEPPVRQQEDPAAVAPPVPAVLLPPSPAERGPVVEIET
jgi:hypothetical protein